MAFDAAEGFTDFVVPVSADEVLWSGAPADGPSEGVDVAGLQSGWRRGRGGR